jgi:histidine triad (HIT) family protein
VTDCLFCSIADGTIPADLVASTDDIVAFRDIAPQAPVHVLVVPRVHGATLHELAASDPDAVRRWLLGVVEVAAALGLEADGYRTVINTGSDGGQTVSHLHAHVLGGRAMGWPPG